MFALLSLPRRATQSSYLRLAQVALVLATSMMTQAHARKPAAPKLYAKAPAAKSHDLFYGVYVGGQKMGFMHQQATDAPRPRFCVDLNASLNAMGRDASLQVSEQRAYDDDGKLASLTFAQIAATGQVEVHLLRQKKSSRYTMRVVAGGETRTETLTLKETLKDHLCLQRLAETGQVGARAKATQFDPSLQKESLVAFEVLALTTRNIDGVPTPCVQVASRYPELEVEEKAWLDRTGKVLESKIGGYFVARLEPKEQAQERHATSDILIGSTVRAPSPLKDPARLKRLTLELSGMGNQTLPETPWQRVVVHQNEPKTLTLTRTAAEWPKVIARGTEHVSVVLPAEAQEALRATSFIQSDATVLIEAAQKATRGCTNPQTKTLALVKFVGQHLRQEYVPAFSNALEAFHSKRGDCTEHSVLFAALARAVGIPARPVVGVAYWAPGQGYGWHAWDEVFVEGVWVPVDPTWHQDVADVTHIKLAEGSPASQAKVVMLLGSLKILSQTAT